MHACKYALQECMCEGTYISLYVFVYVYTHVCMLVSKGLHYNT